MSEGIGGGEHPIRKVIVQTVAPPISGTGLSKTLEFLKAIEVAAAGVNRAMNGMGTNSALKRTKAEIESIIKGAGMKGGTTKMGDVSKLFGVSEQDARAYATRLNKAMRESMFKSGTLDEFGSPAKAARFMHSYNTAALKEMTRPASQLMALMKEMREIQASPAPTAAAVGAAMAKGAVQVDVTGVKAEVVGTIKLEIPASQISASVIGQIKAEGAAGRNEKGQFVSGAGGAGGGDEGGGGGDKKKGKPKEPAASIGRQAGEVERQIRVAGEEVTTRVTAALGPLHTIATTFGHTGEVTQTLEKIQTGKKLQHQAESFMRDEAALVKSTPAGGLRAKQMRQSAVAIENYIQQNKGALAEAGLGEVVQELKRRIGVINQAASELDSKLAARSGRMRLANTKDNASELRREQAHAIRMTDRAERPGQMMRSSYSIEGYLTANRDEMLAAGNKKDVMELERRALALRRGAAELSARLAEEEAGELKRSLNADAARLKRDKKERDRQRKKAEAQSVKDDTVAARKAMASAVELEEAELKAAGWRVRKPKVRQALISDHTGRGRAGQVRETVYEKELGDGRIESRRLLLEQVMGKGGKFESVYGTSSSAVRDVKPKLTGLEYILGGRSFGQAMAENTGKLAMWAGGVGMFYGVIGAAQKAGEAMVKMEYSTARLGQVFRGVGGDARQLSGEVLQEASVQGRSTDEAMEAAVAWSRLGLTKREVNEAVKQSLVAANVAEITAAEATSRLQSVMASYGLTVSQLGGFLGEANQISNTFNVTNAQLFEGLSRVASVAKQAGIPLEELMGIIGAAVGTTGQSGANIGNALKSTIGSLANPEVQKQLRTEFNLEVTTGGGADIKSFPDILRDVWKVYQNLNAEQRQMLVFQIAGKTQASRLTAILDSYVKGQQLAIDAQLHLNSATAENAKIVETVKSQWQGVLTAFDGMAVGMDRALGATRALGDAMAVIKIGMNAIGGAGRMFGADGLLGMLPPVRNLSMLSKGMQLWEARRGRAVLPGSLEGDVKMELLARAGAMGRGARLLETVEGSADEVSTLESVRKATGVGGGSLKETVKLLRAEEKQSRSAGLASGLAQIKTLEAQRDYLKKVGDGGTANQNAIAEVERRLDVIRGKVVQINQEVIDGEDNLEQFKASALAIAMHMERTRAAVEGINSLGSNLAAFGKLDQNQVQAMDLEMQRRALVAKRGAIEADNGMNPMEKRKALEELESDLNSVTAKRAGLLNPMTMGLAAASDRAKIARSIAEAEGRAGDYGDTEVEKLKNREENLRSLMSQKMQMLLMVDDEEQRQNIMVGLEQHRVDLSELLLDKERARLNVKREEHEWQKKLISSGPEDLLRRASAGALVNRGAMSAGQFWSLDAKMREAVVEAQGRKATREFMGETRSMTDVQAEILGTSGNGMVRFGQHVEKTANGFADLWKSMDAFNSKVWEAVNLVSRAPKYSSGKPAPALPQGNYATGGGF